MEKSDDTRACDPSEKPRSTETEMIDWPLEIRLLLCFGVALLVASFLNLAIYRLAWNRRNVSPWSAAPTGLAPRTLWDRIPVLGWLRLRRESEAWGSRFWVRPMLLELCFGLGAVALYWHALGTDGLYAIDQDKVFTVGANFIHSRLLPHLLFICFLVIVTFIDIDEKTIPDNVTLPGTLLGLLLVTLNPWIFPNSEIRMDHQTYLIWTHIASPDAYPLGMPNAVSLGWALGCLWLWIFALLPRFWHGRYGIQRAWKYFWASLFCGRYRRQTFGLLSVGLVLTLGIWIVASEGGRAWVALDSAVSGMACGTVLIWSVRLVGQATLKREAMGFGDVTLMAMIGSFMGWQATLVVFFIAPVAGLAIGLILLAMHRDDEVPYGPFLCAGALITLLLWPSFWAYLGPVFATFGTRIPAILLLCLGLMALLLAIWAQVKKRFFSSSPEA